LSAADLIGFEDDRYEIDGRCVCMFVCVFASLARSLCWVRLRKLSEMRTCTR
jgi:hypothetical protein